MVYKVMANGGVVVAPNAYGLEEEGFKDGVHYMTYKSDQDMMVILKGLIGKGSEKARKMIKKEAKNFVKDKTYLQRIEVILQHNENTGKPIAN
jgi:hypothetical protein